MTEEEIPFPNSLGSDQMKPSPAISTSGMFVDRNDPAPQFSADAFIKGTVRIK